jgi:hypothetical protein
MAAMPAPDRVLVHLLAHLDRHPTTEVTITLTVNGTVISGVLVSPQAFAKRTAEDLRNSLGGHERGEAFDPLFDHIAESADDRAAAFMAAFEADDREAAASIELPEYIHLKDARVLAGPGLLPGNGMWWRGRVDSVDGWAPGQLAPA